MNGPPVRLLGLRSSAPLQPAGKYGAFNPAHTTLTLCRHDIRITSTQPCSLRGIATLDLRLVSDTYGTTLMRFQFP